MDGTSQVHALPSLTATLPQVTRLFLGRFKKRNAAPYEVPHRTDKIEKIDTRRPLCCGQAALVHGTGHSLQDLGVDKLDYGSRLSFANLAEQLNNAGSSPLAKCFKLKKVSSSIQELVRCAESGIYLVHCYWLNEEDCETFFESHSSKEIRNAHALGYECVPHFIVMNLDTNVMFITPELDFITPKDRADPNHFLDRMRDEYHLVFDTSGKSSGNIRQLYIQATDTAAEFSCHNTPDILENYHMRVKSTGSRSRKRAALHRSRKRAALHRGIASASAEPLPKRSCQWPREFETEIEVETEPCDTSVGERVLQVGGMILLLWPAHLFRCLVVTVWRCRNPGLRFLRRRTLSMQGSRRQR